MGYQHSWFKNEKSGLSGFYNAKFEQRSITPCLHKKVSKVLMIVDTTRSQANPSNGVVEHYQS